MNCFYNWGFFFKDKGTFILQEYWLTACFLTIYCYFFCLADMVKCHTNVFQLSIHPPSNLHYTLVSVILYHFKSFNYNIFYSIMSIRLFPQYSNPEMSGLSSSIPPTNRRTKLMHTMYQVWYKTKMSVWRNRWMCFATRQLWWECWLYRHSKPLWLSL